jgi:hypothetical protein
MIINIASSMLCRVSVLYSQSVHTIDVCFVCWCGLNVQKVIISFVVRPSVRPPGATSGSVRWIFVKFCMEEFAKICLDIQIFFLN